MSKRTYRIVGISILILTMSFLLGDETDWATSSTNVAVSVTPGNVDYNVSGNINLGSIVGSIVSTTLTGIFSTGSFWTKDFSGVYYAGTKQRKISSSQMTGTRGWAVPVNTYYVIRPNPTVIVTFSGTATSGASITSSSWRLDISSLQQQPLMTLINNSGYLYRVSITPSLAITIPAGQQVDTYQAVLTVTVPWSS